VSDRVRTRAAFPGRGLTLLVGLLLAVVAGALGPGAATAAPPARVVFVQDTLGNDWRAAQVEAVRRRLAPEPGVRFEVRDAQGSTARQILQVENVLAEGVDVLMTSPRHREALAPVLTRAYRSGTPVILLSRDVVGDQYTTFIHPDDRAIARAIGRLVVERLGGEGRVLMLAGLPGTSTAMIRREAFMEVVGEYPAIQVVARPANFLRADAIRVVEDLLGAGQRFDAVYAHSDSMASGARMALERSGIDPRSLYIAGIDYIRESREAIRRGLQAVSFTYPTGGREGAEAALRILRGEPVPREVVLDSVQVDVANVDAVEPIF
jgi:ribose transport system substrate-binding protein